MHNRGLCSFLTLFQYLSYPNNSILFWIGLCSPLVVTLLETSQDFIKQGFDPQICVRRAFSGSPKRVSMLGVKEQLFFGISSFSAVLSKCTHSLPSTRMCICKWTVQRARNASCWVYFSLCGFVSWQLPDGLRDVPFAHFQKLIVIFCFSTSSLWGTGKCFWVTLCPFFLISGVFVLFFIFLPVFL